MMTGRIDDDKGTMMMMMGLSIAITFIVMVMITMALDHDMLDRDHSGCHGAQSRWCWIAMVLDRNGAMSLWCALHRDVIYIITSIFVY